MQAPAGIGCRGLRAHKPLTVRPRSGSALLNLSPSSSARFFLLSSAVVLCMSSFIRCCRCCSCGMSLGYKRIGGVSHKNSAGDIVTAVELPYSGCVKYTDWLTLRARGSDWFRQHMQSKSSLPRITSSAFSRPGPLKVRAGHEIWTSFHFLRRVVGYDGTYKYKFHHLLICVAVKPIRHICSMEFSYT